MENDLGGFGVYAKYKPPAANYFISNYLILSNTLPELRRAANDPFLSESLAPEYANGINDAMNRYSGQLDIWVSEARARQRNPLKWFSEGVRSILLAPAALLREFGLPISASGSGTLFRALSALAAFVAFLSGLVTVVTGWAPFAQFARSIWSRYVP